MVFPARLIWSQAQPDALAVVGPDDTFEAAGDDSGGHDEDRG